MAISRVTTWSAGQVLTAAALNAEFDNILNNALSLVSPWTANMAAGGFRLTGLATGSAASPSWSFTGDASSGIFQPGASRVTVSTNSVARFEVGSGGAVFINSTSNSAMTFGLTMAQGTSVDEILSMKASNVAHGMTSVAETDTYGSFLRLHATGDLVVRGFDSVTTALQLQALHTTDNVLKTSLGYGAIVMDGYKKSGTTIGALGANANLLSLTNAGTVKFIFNGDGSSYQAIGTAWTTMSDTEDDVALLTALCAGVSGPQDPVHREFAHFMRDHRDTLERLDIVHFNDGPGDDGEPFLNTSKLLMLLTGAVRQTADRISKLEEHVGVPSRPRYALALG